MSDKYPIFMLFVDQAFQIRMYIYYCMKRNYKNHYNLPILYKNSSLRDDTNILERSNGTCTSISKGYDGNRVAND